MDVQAALLAAIADRPDDDTPRLVYADWLDDHADDAADPDAARARAEFIRVQCAVKQLGHLPSADQQAYVDLYRRQDVLLTQHRRDLIGPVSDDIGPHDAVFDRGFVTEIELTPIEFVAHADDLAALAPLPRVKVSGVARYLDYLTHAERFFPLIAVANMQSPRWRWDAVTADQLRAMFAGDYGWDGLQELNLEYCEAGDDGLVAVAGSEQLPGLTYLAVPGNEISDEGVRALVASPIWPRLRSLVLGANPISDEGAVALADAPPTAIEYLNLKYTGLTPHGQQRVLRRKGWKVDLF
jgi:uncharacterized protein (TIGR02996 family)